MQLAKVPLRAESWPLSRRQGDCQVRHSGRVARRGRVAVRTCCQRAGFLLLHRAVRRLEVRHSDPEDRQQLQGIHVSTQFPSADRIVYKQIFYTGVSQ